MSFKMFFPFAPKIYAPAIFILCNHLLNYAKAIVQTGLYYLFLQHSIIIPLNIITVKSFRLITIAVLVTLSAFAAVLFSSCKNKCGSTTCQNSGVCSDNVCECTTGYSGNSCQNSWSGVAVGTYNCTRSSCTQAISGPATWQSTVVTDATNGGYTVDISNFDGANITVIATIDSAKGTISNMSINNGSDGINANGSYNSTNSTINFVYALYAGCIRQYQCNMTMVKVQ